MKIWEIMKKENNGKKFRAELENDFLVVVVTNKRVTQTEFFLRCTIIDGPSCFTTLELDDAIPLYRILELEFNPQ